MKIKFLDGREEEFKTLAGANLTGADLRWADLRGANLYKANLYKANLIKANLAEANLYKANLTEANLKWADLEEADLTEADLRGADLRWANLTEANLTEANLTEANLTEANLTGAYLMGITIFSNQVNNLLKSLKINLKSSNKNQIEDEVVQSFVEEIISRSQVGISKYGTTLADSPESLLAFVKHAKQEAIDLGLYLENIERKIKSAEEKKNN